jgi:hypothetical protein
MARSNDRLRSIIAGPLSALACVWCQFYDEKRQCGEGTIDAGLRNRTDVKRSCCCTRDAGR